MKVCAFCGRPVTRTNRPNFARAPLEEQKEPSSAGNCFILRMSQARRGEEAGAPPRLYSVPLGPGLSKDGRRPFKERAKWLNRSPLEARSEAPARQGGHRGARLRAGVLNIAFQVIFPPPYWESDRIPLLMIPAHHIRAREHGDTTPRAYWQPVMGMKLSRVEAERNADHTRDQIGGC
ncbi:hypothetical protein NDU88_001154 [Pleurodeles waltl]|uniref:Uncharacterized protein n=1 Tax=Pleurodeles waltl TaxID=8319 RepID=A0AAV7V8Y6_PLEWA|nr:hypothetical protein NDU88_001154 [Pleurodeles waltl]